jgi:transcription elongation factor Elf1
MGKLRVVCKSCHQKFDSPIQMDQEAFKNPTNQMYNNSYQCPHCGQSAVYNKEDHTYED